MTGKFALVFGNTQYADPALAQLTAPGKDAEELARVLKAPDFCGFDEVTVCVNERSPSAIEAIDSFFDGRKPDDLLVLYFSGHGIRDELGALYLAFSNTIRSRLRSTALKAEYVREAMDESRSKRQVLILDCCNSGAFPTGTKADLGAAMGMAAALQGYGRYVLTASDATQFAWEGDRIIGETSNSLFTHFLVKGLEGDADHDGDGCISVDDLYDYTFGQISRVTPKQTPTKSASKQEGEIVLRRITRLEDIKRMSLPDELMEAIADSRTFVREGAVQQLAKLLSGRNLGLARSARETLEKICAEDDSLRVRKAAGDALAPVRAAEQQAREQAEMERLAALKAQEELAAQQKAEVDRIAAVKAREEQLARAKAEQERRDREKAEAQLLAKRKAEEELAAKHKAEKEELAAQQKAEGEKLAQAALQKEEHERFAREKAEAERLVAVNAQEQLETRREGEEQRLRLERAEQDRLVQQKAESERLAQLKAEEQRVALQTLQQEERARKTGEQATTAQPNLRPRWLSIIWISLGSAIGGAILFTGGATSSASWNTVLAFAGFGLCVGLATALVLYLEHTIAHWQSALGVALGWLVAWAIASIGITWAVWGLLAAVVALLLLAWVVGGCITAVILYAEHALSSRSSVGWVTLAWAIGGGVFLLSIVFLAQSAFRMGADNAAILFAISGALGAAIGSTGTIWLIRKAGGKNVQLAAG